MEQTFAPVKPSLCWFCAYTPEEIIVAAGFRSRRILGRPGSAAKAEAYLHPNLCSYVRACFNSVLEGEYKDLSGIIAVDSCDAMRSLFDALCCFTSAGFSHILSLPHRRDLSAVNFFANELRRLIDCLNNYFALRISEEDLRNAIRTVNSARILLIRLAKQRAASPSFSGQRYYELLREAMTGEIEDFQSRAQRELETAKQAVNENENAVRIVLAGGILDDPWVVGAIEEAGGRVVADDMCCGSRYFEGLVSEEEEPIPAIARRYILRPQCARMADTEERIRRLMATIDDSGARGLIYYGVKFC
ncbi:MAG: 2-hydroxyacyl-CoA dehydratase, partial [Candidatus Lindowbacteria bacterium]|nr:2-hydroxyacyl-CoA dehydratase [Candidatus Lindowbacteria bacterium]